MKLNIYILIPLICSSFIASSQIATTLNFSVVQLPCITGLNSAIEFQPEVSIFPNPSNGKVEISIKGKNDFLPSEIKITSVLGKTVLYMDGKNPSKEYIKQIDLSAFPNGIYFIHVYVPCASFSKVLRIALTK